MTWTRNDQRAAEYAGYVYQLEAEIERLRAELKEQQRVTDFFVQAGEQERFKKLDAEIERLRELLRGVGANRYWEGRYRDAIEECARAAKKFIESKPMTSDLAGATCTAIRALKEKTP